MPKIYKKVTTAVLFSLADTGKLVYNKENIKRRGKKNG